MSVAPVVSIPSACAFVEEMPRYRTSLVFHHLYGYHGGFVCIPPNLQRVVAMAQHKVGARKRQVVSLGGKLASPARWTSF